MGRAAHYARILMEIVSNPHNGFSFPLLHGDAQPRNVIECAYGVLKTRFYIGKDASIFPVDVQINIVACFVVHNFIRKMRINDDLFKQYESPQLIFNEEEEEHKEVWIAASSQIMSNMREELVLQLMQRNGNT
ncbi:hypothetical protein R3W88_032204 [Solanum pinnatisectum]|uniref:DDE Tnp4 domain-containing protein n=1 Tax=Solanum pinnatisectum TaxID=50273 RepID=A0AAV9LSF5_9SOLN|nr:hypothetical protein R3W88_032204 [Solanum pinnatisectum]